jgi:hypothetical protein
MHAGALQRSFYFFVGTDRPGQVLCKQQQSYPGPGPPTVSNTMPAAFLYRRNLLLFMVLVAYSGLNSSNNVNWRLARKNGKEKGKTKIPY